MKALVIGSSNIRLMPYLFGYFEQLTKYKYEITLFYWDRDGQKDRSLPEDIRTVCFKANMKNYIPKIAKVTNFLKYRKEALKEINTRKYDLIIVSNAQFAVLLSDILLKYYKKKYIFDYRDPSYEKIKIYKKRLASIVINSIATFISSDAYRELLPKCEHIYTTHNITAMDLKHREVRRSLSRETKIIRISFWGLIRDTETNLSLIREIGNDNRFELHYYGIIEKTAKAIMAYCEQFGINNVHMYNEYLPDERYDFAKTTDIIHNAYNNNGSSNPRMTNKFYEGIIFYIPQICTAGGFMSTEVEKYGVGIIIDPSVSFRDKLYNYYLNLDWTDFEKKCDDCLEKILKEQENTDSVLGMILK
jgi:hypothetical protein